MFWWIPFIIFNFCATLLWWFMRHIFRAIWKSRHWHFSINIDTAKFNFSFTTFFWKNKTFITINTLVLIYLTPVSLCNNYAFLYYLFFFHPETSIGVLEKRLFEFLDHSSIISSKKIRCNENKHPVKHPFWSR